MRFNVAQPARQGYRVTAVEAGDVEYVIEYTFR